MPPLTSKTLPRNKHVFFVRSPYSAVSLAVSSSHKGPRGNNIKGAPESWTDSNSHGEADGLRRHTCKAPLLFYAPAVWSVFVAPPAAASSCLAFKSFTAALMASSASMLQCNFTGGSCVVKKGGATPMAAYGKRCAVRNMRRARRKRKRRREDRCCPVLNVTTQAETISSFRLSLRFLPYLKVARNVFVFDGQDLVQSLAFHPLSRQ